MFLVELTQVVLFEQRQELVLLQVFVVCNTVVVKVVLHSTKVYFVVELLLVSKVYIFEEELIFRLFEQVCK